MTRSPHRRVQRAALIGAGLVLGLVLLEAGLQLALRRKPALLWQLAPAPADRARVVIVCAGDSHTYGLGYHPHVQSCPAQLQALLGPHFAVENHGIPGRNVGQAGGRLAARLAAGPVDLVLFLAGFNDWWNHETTPEPGFRLVLPRLWQLLRFNRKAHPLAAETIRFADGRFFTVDAEGRRQAVEADARRKVAGTARAALAARIRAGLEQVVALCAGQGVPLVLQTYADESLEVFRPVNATIREVAAATGTPLVDHARWFAELRRRETPPAAPGWFHLDGHPTALGYRRMAEHLGDALRATPPGRDWPAPGGAGAAVPGAQAAAGLVIGAAVAEEDGRLTVPLRGPAEQPYRLVLALGTVGDGPDARLASDALCRDSRAQAIGLTGRFDAAGRAEAQLYPFLLAPHAGREIVAQLELLAPQPGEDGSETPVARSLARRFRVP